MRAISAALLGLGMSVVAASQASATVATCSSIYHGLGTAGQANGSTTLPGTDVGTVQQGCQVGDLATNNVSGTGIFVSPTANPSIIQFTWGGGFLLIEEALGNNGTLPLGVDVELGLLAGNTLQSNKSLTNPIASINFSSPFVFAAFQTLFEGDLAAGIYVVDTYSGTIAEDPTYQINFSLSPVPEPMTIGLLGVALLGVGVAARRRRHV